MPAAGLMRDRITLERYVEGANNVGHAWATVATIWAATEPQGDGRYRFRVRYREDLPLTRGELEPAMRVLYRGEYHDLDDVVESVHRTELQLLASRRIVEEIDHLRTGTRRIKTWP